MKIQVAERFFSFKIIWICVFMLVLAIIISFQYPYHFRYQAATSTTSSKCPFQHLYHLGDGITDIGNSIHTGRSDTPNPAAELPYGMTYPGWPSGRWSDGRIDFDYSSADFGLPNIVPYLTMNSTNNDGVVFSVARSPVLDNEFFESRGIVIPSYAVSLSNQMSWFKTYLKSVCSTQKDCAKLLRNSLLLLGDIEANDIGYALTQGKSIEEVKTYVPFIVMALIDASRELIKLGATKVIIPGNVPVGCYPYILTAFETDDPTAYDDLLCLKSVNDLIVWKNNYTQKAIADLTNEFPGVTIYYGNMYDGLRSLIRNASVIGPEGNSALKACCGIGGKYNFDSKRFCGSCGVPVCSNPHEYVYWDGMHYTQHTHFTFEQLLVRRALEIFNCTSGSTSHVAA